MVRRTKEDALATRESIIDAAELLFEKNGVSRTSLQHIAEAAGVTRGAIYWHFADKGALFNAMMDRATMPLEAALEPTDGAMLTDPLKELGDWLVAVFRLTATDAKTRRVFEIATHKIEYVEELLPVRDRHLASYERWLVRAEERIRLGVKRGLVKATLPPSVMALALCATVDGLLNIWLLNPEAFDLLQEGRKIIDAQIDSLRVDCSNGKTPSAQPR